MQWSPRQARFTLLLFLLLFAAGQVKACLIIPIYPDLGRIEGSWPPEGLLLDATVFKHRALEVFPPGTTAAAALDEMGLMADPLGSGHCLPRAGVLEKRKHGWAIRPMSQRERWVWRIPMDLYMCEPEDLQRIKGIGPSLAGRVYWFVQKKGALQSLRDLDEVSGVGPGKMSVLEKELALY
jgi:hypothetical protein